MSNGIEDRIHSSVRVLLHYWELVQMHDHAETVLGSLDPAIDREQYAFWEHLERKLWAAATRAQGDSE